MCRTALVSAAIFLAVCLTPLSLLAQDAHSLRLTPELAALLQGTYVPQWRNSFAAFARALDALPLSTLPQTVVKEVGHIEGERVPADREIMKRFGGPVEFTAVFERVFTEDFMFPPPDHRPREKIMVALDWPPDLRADVFRKIHLYPQAASLEAWKALPPTTVVTFRASLTGISVYQFLPGVPGVSILLEEGEIVSTTASPRTSFGDFAKAIAAFPIQNIPWSNPDRTDLTGLRVSAEQDVMKRFGGPVEFAGTFQGVSRDFDSVLAKPTNRERVDIDLAIPEVPGGPANWTVRLYPKASTVKAWKALRPNTPVTFRAVVTGVTRNKAWIPGVDLRWFSILLEDGEIVLPQKGVDSAKGR